MCSSFAVGRSGPTRVAPPQRELDKGGVGRGFVAKLGGFLTMDGSCAALLKGIAPH